MEIFLVVYLTLEGYNPHDQGSHHNALIIDPIGAFFVSTIDSEIIIWTFWVHSTFTRLNISSCLQLEKLCNKIFRRHAL